MSNSTHFVRLEEQTPSEGKRERISSSNEGAPLQKRTREDEQEEEKFLKEISAVPVPVAADGPLDVHLVVVLDESSSMASQTQEVVDGLNTMLKEQRQIEGKVMFSLVTFNNNVKCKVNRMDINDVADLTLLDYHPSGCTALYDGIGETIMNFKDLFGVIMVIATDGCENSSRSFSSPRVKMMISNCEKKLDWKFMYLCEGVDSFSEVARHDSGDMHHTGGQGTMGSYFASPAYHVSLSRNRNLSAYSPSETDRDQSTNLD